MQSRAVHAVGHAPNDFFSPAATTADRFSRLAPNSPSATKPFYLITASQAGPDGSGCRAWYVRGAPICGDGSRVSHDPRQSVIGA